ncbi:hypothetical protein Taro_034717 [Colocasia esculenta]|uniref:HAT C-terminal dimerisation domain-containing protein n=1 Tax=Colocasia esculenta TaxID=4460 RepID=A0A843W1N0_COLES|nr:hypothetical protein [Colocasia esculenta]
MVNRISRNHENAAATLNELKYFNEGIGSFSDPSAIASRQKLDPGEWWLSYGRSSPTLREIAIRVLSQTSSSSGCERNWSTFALIHTKVRNRLSHRRLDNLVYVHYNMRLRLKHVQMDDKKGDRDYYPTDMSYLRDDEDPMVSWVSRSTTEREEMELDEEADDPDDPPRPNIFLVSIIERMQAGRDVRVAEDTPVTQTHHSDSEVDLDNDMQVGSLTRANREPTTWTHYEMDTANLDMLIQPRAPPQS